MDDDLTYALIRNEVRVDKQLRPDCRIMRFAVGRRHGLGWRLDRYLRALNPRWPAELTTRWVQDGRALVDGQVADPAHLVKPGERIELRMPLAATAEPLPPPPPLQILWRDPHLCVLNKPPGQLAHQAGRQLTGTLINQLHELAFAEGRDPNQIRLVNRIDRDTSGIVLASLNLDAHRALSAAMDAGQFHKEYQALCLGVPEPRQGEWTEPLGELGPHTIRHGVVEGGSVSRTGYRVEDAAPGGTASLVHLVLFTGRQHQIRIHASHHGHALVGDWVYGQAIAELPGQALHAAVLELPHPVTGERLRCEAPLPPRLAELWARLRGGWLPSPVPLTAEQRSKLDSRPGSAGA